MVFFNLTQTDINDSRNRNSTEDGLSQLEIK